MNDKPPIGWFFSILGQSDAVVAIDLKKTDGTHPFHASFRPSENCVVLNRRTETGWQKEILLPFDSTAGVNVSVLLALVDTKIVVQIQDYRFVWETMSEADLADSQGHCTTARSIARPIYLLTPSLVADLSSAVAGYLLPIGGSIVCAATVGCIETTDDCLSISGWACRPSGTRPVLELDTSAGRLDCVVRSVSRSDLFPQINDEELGFEVELPGVVWRRVGEDGTVVLRVTADGQPLIPGRIVLRPWECLPRLLQICKRQPVAPEHVPLALLALEHLAAPVFHELMTLEDRKSVCRLAETFNLRSLLPEWSSAEPADAIGPDHALAAETRRTKLIWTALRDVSQALSEPRDHNGSQSAHTIISDIVERRRFRGITRRKFLVRVFDILCDFGEMARVSELMDLSEFDYLIHSDSAWELSLAPGILMAQNRFRETTEVLYRLRDMVAEWRSTSTIEYVAKELIRHLQVETISPEESRVLFDAILAVITSFQSGWSGRLYDERLTRAAAKLLRVLEFFPSLVTDEYCRFALAQFGLHAGFWAAVKYELSIRATEPPPLLATAMLRFEELTAALNSKSVQRDGNHSLGAAGALLFFARRQNGDVPLFVRELVLGHLLNTRAIGATENYLLDLLGFVSPNDLIRLIAHPQLHGSTPLLLGSRERGALVRETIARLGGRPVSPRGQVQRNAGQILRALEKAALERREEAQYALALSLATVASSLCVPAADFLGLDLLVGGIAAADSGATADMLGEALEYHLTRGGVEHAVDSTPPAPLFAARMRLEGLARSGVAHRSEVAAQLLDYFDQQFLGFADFLSNPPAEAKNGRFHGDTVVAVYTCVKNLSTRVSAIRDTWLKSLAPMGVPHVVVVGDGDGRLDGDILRLAVSDDYESLPAKTLALIKWFIEESGASYLVKIDDDCFLNVEDYFNFMNYRRFHYYGRRIDRAIGTTDRRWHQKKSRGAYAANAIDRSPEPSAYADGGGAYAISRLAASMALEEADSPWGRRLRSSSFMEDKLLGDLLAKRGIHPANDDYESYQRRRTFAEAIPVGMWENTFFPSQMSPTIVVHLDAARDQAKAQASLNAFGLAPSKIWPTESEIGLLPNSHQLELVSDREQANALLEESIFVVCVQRNERVMLPHFLDCYRKLGVRAFLFADNLSDDGSREYLLGQPDVVLYSVDSEYKASHYGVIWQQAMLGNHCLGKWALIADADEFLVLPSRFASIAEFCASLDREEATAACILMIDMYPRDPLEDADFNARPPFECAPWFDRQPVQAWALSTGYYSNAPTYVSSLRHRLMPDGPPQDFVSQKCALIRYAPGVRLGEGLHYVANLKAGTTPSWFAHFKYHSGFKKKVIEETARAQHFDNAAEYRRYARMLGETAVKFWREDLSVRFTGPESFEKYVATETIGKETGA